ncbi:uncharacterized protein LOC133198542 [Saccostrea echinata]|uniref:uncharacterized protein LOC133198542 n=1 Tax=Saccostrea echinata TaxID=191078 RepID=UPI002A80A3F4|nr:uncharacterized protein LOC133198542 [Saccostrea echinata]
MEEAGSAPNYSGDMKDKDLLDSFEKWFDDKCKKTNLVHFYYGRADIATKKIQKGDGVIVAVIDNMEDIEKKTSFLHRGKNVQVIWKFWKEDSEEASLGMEEEQKLQDQQIEKLEKIEKFLEENANDLFEKHSNLEMIVASTYRIKKGRIEITPCIVLYCSCKGIVPINESKFPTEIDEFKTDVREGFFHLHWNLNEDVCAVSKDLLNPLRMGASIGTKDKQTEGTLGGFVRSNDEIGFITCAHVLYDSYEMETENLPSTPITVVQPSQLREGSQECGQSIRSVSSFSNVNAEKITVDATLVKLTERLPQQLFFADLLTARLIKYGFSRTTFPRYIGGTPLDLRKVKDRTAHLSKKYLKCGTTSGLTMGSLRLFSFRGRLRDSQTRKGTRRLRNEFYENQLVMRGENFSAPGDSGSFVFQVREDYIGRLDCVGMIVGAYKDKVVVTPIIPVLNALGASLIPFP